MSGLPQLLGEGTPSTPPDQSSSNVEPVSDGGFQSCPPPLQARTFTASKPGNCEGSAQMPGNGAQMGPAATAGWCEPAGLGRSPRGPGRRGARTSGHRQHLKRGALSPAWFSVLSAPL